MVVRIVSQVVDGGIIVRGGITVMVQGFKDYYLCTSRLNNSKVSSTTTTGNDKAKSSIAAIMPRSSRGDDVVP